MMIKRLLPLLLTMSVLVSCDMGTEAFLYRGFMMGFLQDDDSFKGDDGRTYVFSNISAGYDWQGATRLLALFDVAEQMSDGRYSAKLLECLAPLYKEPLKSTELDPSFKLSPDPINVQDAWYSGGCINMYNSFRYRTDDKTLHAVNLVVDLSRPVADTLHLRLWHDAGEDSLDSDAQPTDYDLYRFYTSFPVASFFPEGKQEGVIEIKWTWEDGDKELCNKVNLK